MTIGIVNYVTSSGEGSSWSFQNFFVNNSDFAPFAITGRGARKGGDRSDVSLVLSNDPVSLSFANEIVSNRHLVTVQTSIVDGASLSAGGIISEEIWTAASMTVDIEKIVIRLTSPLDAVRSQFPRRQLSSVLVGSLPITGNLVIS